MNDDVTAKDKKKKGGKRGGLSTEEGRAAVSLHNAGNPDLLHDAVDRKGFEEKFLHTDRFLSFLCLAAATR